ncbi:unnamed protein product, partial [Rotaria sp. Silwood1]
MATKETSLRQCIDELSAKNTDYKFPEQAINQAESLKSLSSDLYSDNIRFIYEKNQIHVAYAILLNNVGEINSALNQLIQQPYMFLFLRNICRMTFLTQSIDTISIDRNLSHGLKNVNVNKEINSQWIIKRLELDIPDDMLEKLSKDTKAPEKLRFIKKAEMFFAAKYKPSIHNANGEVISGGIEKLREQDSVLFSFLPTKIFEYKFPVLINANFLTNVNREQIHTDSVWNQWLFDKISGEIFQWIKELVKNNKFHFQAYRLIPSKLNPENNILTKRFNDSFARCINHCNFIRNRKNQLLRVNEVIMDLTAMSKQSSFINITSMREYIIKNEETSSQYANDPFIDYDLNLNQIGVEKFTWDQCINMFKSDIFLKTHSIEENKRMIEYFYTKYSKIDTNDGMDIDIQQIPFLMDQNYRLQLIKDIYFPANTMGDNGTNDSEYIFVNKTIFAWLNEKAQKGIKQWLKGLGVDERTDLTYLHKTIIPNVASYITRENAIKTIKMLFILFQKNAITKKEFDQLKMLKLLTTCGTLVLAEQCFFCDQYKPRLQLEEYLKKKEDKFLSFDYVTSHNSRKENDDLTEWRRFFIGLGVQEDLHPVVLHRKLTSYEAARYEFCDEYLSTTSPDDTYEFAKFFWSDVVKNIKPEVLTQKIKVYWGHSDKRGAIEGTLLDDADYISWFVKNRKCIPTTVNTCELSNKIFIDSKDLKELCGKYMYFPSILLPQEKTSWHEIFNFKTELSIDDYFDLLQKIRYDEKNLKDNLDRVQMIYFHILKKIYYWSSDEREAAKARVKSLYLLTENEQWKLASDLYFYMEGNGANNNLNDAIPCLKLDYKNRNHPHLTKFLDLCNIKQIRMNDLKLADKKSSPAEQFRRKLIEISPFLKKWLKHLSVSSDIISSVDKKIQQENDFVESDSLELFYNQNFVQKTNVYFDSRNKQLYVARPWDSETTFINLPNKLCQLLNIHEFEDKLRFLLKGTIEEIKKHFTNNSIEIPTNNDIIILEPLSSSNVLKQPKPCATTPSDSNKSSPSNKNKETNTSKPEITPETAETPIANSKNQKNNNDTAMSLKQPYPVFPQHPQFTFYVPIQRMNVPTDPCGRTLPFVFSTSEDEEIDNIELMHASSITPSNGVLLENLSDGTGEFESFELNTGRIGEEMVYKYLLNEYRDHPNPVIIKWLNQNQETHLPYDISLTKNGKTHYIEVKSTCVNNQHIFPLSINQIETFLKLRENYFIYRVYIGEKTFIILDNIPWRLMQKQLACFLRILPRPSD